MLTGLTKRVLEAGLEAELTEHVGYAKHAAEGRDGGNSRNGTRPKTVVTEFGPVKLDVPRDRDSSFEPQLVKKHPRRLRGVDEMVISLTAKGLTTGEVQAHLAEGYGTDVSRETVLKITDAVSTDDDGWFFPAPDGDTWPVDRWRKRRFDRWANAADWPTRADYWPHRSVDPPHTETTCPSNGRARRRWRWSLHAWRHHAACYQLFELGLDAEDVASHLGHRDGYSCWQLYVGARPRRQQRLSVAVTRTGDPRR